MGKGKRDENPFIYDSILLYPKNNYRKYKLLQEFSGIVVEIRPPLLKQKNKKFLTIQALLTRNFILLHWDGLRIYIK